MPKIRTSPADTVAFAILANPPLVDHDGLNRASLQLHKKRERSLQLPELTLALAKMTTKLIVDARPAAIKTF
jgi:hypothetical protein